MYLLSFLLFAPAFIFLYNLYPNTPITGRIIEICFSGFYFLMVMAVGVAGSLVMIAGVTWGRRIAWPRIGEIIEVGGI